MLEQLGATLIDADAIVHELQAPGTPVLARIEEAFGPEVIDASGALDREALAAIVFRDDGARERLGKIVHPAVGAEMGRRLATARAAGDALVVIDIPLLFEGRRAGTSSAAALGFDVTVVVYAPEETQVERQLERESYDRDEALRRIRAQMPLSEKRELADFTIDNAGSLEETRRHVRDLYATLATGGDVH